MVNLPAGRQVFCFDIFALSRKALIPSFFKSYFMARLRNGFLGHISGTLGDKVYYVCNGKQYVRTRPTKSKKNSRKVVNGNKPVENSK
jgi:hypothetical protein